jgi:hypothetical protein
MPISSTLPELKILFSGQGGEGLVRHLYEQHLKANASLLPNSQPFICPCCWYESSGRLSLLKHMAATHAQFFQQTGPRCWQVAVPSQRLSDECQDPSRTMIQVAMGTVYLKPSPVAPEHRLTVSELSSGEEDNPLRTFIQKLLLPPPDSETEEEDAYTEVDHSLAAQIRRWKEDAGIQPGVVLGYPDHQKDTTTTSQEKSAASLGEAEGLRTLAPRHALTLQESTRLCHSLSSSSSQSAPSHSWLCDGRLLHLMDAASPANLALFQYQWARGQPVLISNSNRYLDRRLWHPRAFLKDFGHLRSDLVNTLTGKTVPQQPLKWFWEGFNSVCHRLVDASGTPMLLKLKAGV